eukprot:g8483.t1
MNDPNEQLPQGFQQEFIQHFLPLGVAEEITLVHAEIIRNSFPDEILPVLFPQGNFPLHVHPVAPPPPLPNFEMDVWLTYRDRTVERQFLKWESDINRWSFPFCSLFFFCFFLLHLSFCNDDDDDASVDSSNAKQHDFNWPCGGDDLMIFLIATALIWIPAIAALLPKPQKWKYRELASGIHQLLFGILVPLYVRQLLSETEVNLILFCTVPIVVESVLLRVRLRWHLPLSIVVTSLVLSPWLRSTDDQGGTTESTTPLIATAPMDADVLTNLIAMLILPACLVALHESRLRQRFQETF